MLYVVMTLVGLLSLAGPAWAAGPGETLRGIFTEATRVMSDPDTEERPLDRLIALEKLAGDSFDFRGAAELALGRRWSRVTPAEQDEFTQLFAGFLGRAVLFRMQTKAKLEGGSAMEFLGESITGNEAMVLTSIPREKGSTRVDYRMIERDGQWKVRDVIVEGLAMTSNYRAQIDRILETSSMADLLAKMRATVGVGAGPATASAAELPPSPKRDLPAPAKPQATPAVAKADTPAVAKPEAVALAKPEATAVAKPEAVAITKPQMPAVAPEKAPATVKPATVAVAKPDAPAPKPAPATTKAYWLYLGGVNTAAEMGRLIAGIPGSTIVMAREGEGTAAKVVLKVGPFQDAAQAVSELLELQMKGYDPYLVAERR